MLTTYLKNIDDAGMQAKTIAKYAEDIDAIDIQNYLAEVAGAMFKAAWMLKATLRSK
jgi:hypothetical protein